MSVIFKHSSLTYCILLVKDQSSFYVIHSLSYVHKHQAFSWINSKQLNIMKTF